MVESDGGGRNNAPRSRDDGDITMLCAEPEDLDAVVSVPQAFDNQWIPREHLDLMARKGVPDDDEIERRRRPLVRQEYMRSLVTSMQVVINRAFCQNNPAINQDFAAPGADREAFISLLESRVVVPFLYRESSPLVEPEYSTKEWAAWRQVISESRPTCLRLSWESDELNRKMTERYLTGPFAAFLKNLDALEPPLLIHEMGLGDDQESALQDHLREIARWSQQRFQDGEPLTRDPLYQRYVTADGTPTAARRYDFNKPFAALTKQLLDLRYNANSPDALGAYLLTPDDTVGRRAMQEWAWEGRGRGRATDADQLIDAIRPLRFAEITNVLGALAAFEYLTLSDVTQLRHTEEWLAYQRILRRFLDERSLAIFEESDHGAQQVVAAYGRMIGVAGEIAGKRRAEARVGAWEPVMELVVEFAGAVLSLHFGGAGNMTYSVGGEIAGGAVTRTAKAMISMVIGRYTRARTKTRIGNSIRLLEYRFERGRRDWDDFVRALDASGFRNISAAAQDRDARLEKPIDE